jgi:tetratricopeptide (TPR) repeat protein
MFLMISNMGMAQSFSATPAINLDEQLAAEFYNRGEFDKAIGYYKKLLQQKPESQFIYQQFLNCVFNTKDYKTAEQELKLLIKKTKDPIEIQIDLGYIYTLSLII